MAWCRAGPGRGEVTIDPGVQITIDRGYVPDVGWYPQERCAPPGERPSFDGPPALAVEVLSPTTRTVDALRKPGDYARVGIDELWIIDAEQPTALIYRRAQDAQAFVLAAELGADDALTTPLLPDFAVTLPDLVTR